jgi:hypothetical protein
MPLRRCRQAMMRQDALKVQSERFGDRAAGHCRILVKNDRRSMGQLSIAREEIAAEKQTARFAKVAGMPCRMAGKVNGPESPQDWKSTPFFDRLIRGKRLKAKHTPPHSLEPSGEAIESVARRATGITIEIRRRAGDPCTMLAGNGRGIQDTIEMPMSQENATLLY